MRVIVTGAAGMLGQAVLALWGKQHEVTGLTRSDCDLRDTEGVKKVFSRLQPGLILHLAAYTDVDGCEREPQHAHECNAQAAQNVAQAALSLAAALVYISTDYVFSGGQSSPYREEDPTGPLNVYGASKLAGENHVRALLDRHFIVRTSWLFGSGGKNFVSTILKLGAERSELRVVDDQRGSPTYTRHLATKLLELAATQKFGTYHITGAGSCSWFEFAQSIVKAAGGREVPVVPITSAEYVRPARRPANSVLENRRLAAEGFSLLPHWRWGLQSYLSELETGQKPLVYSEMQHA
jgi:dTDP-4-dehydrorhamnose reductase